ncbi:MAG: SLBB domain-containing protein [Chloroflexi bacterium]|nr:SLBB domain-containing protein [Chloroflexota bacterium]MBU1747962.1 SLBB domain-containing protein [Chloroflexota bacterium]MBU1878577.1 SLBB domain-containing protein [Chloroflexota bacterium]
MDADQIVKNVREAGVVGAGGAGFPTHVKLAAQVQTVIANGAECEPLLQADRCLMAACPADVVTGLRLAMDATGASRGVIALKAEYEDAVAALEPLAARHPDIDLHRLGSYYPAGDEFLLVEDVTGQVIPEGGLPLHVGVVVNNVGTLANVAGAGRGLSVTQRILTVVGQVRRPLTLRVPVGTPVRDVLAYAGGPTLGDGEYAVLLGGPLMGRLLDDLDVPVLKTTSGVVVLPAEHYLVRRKSRTVATNVRWARSACDQCRDCTELCPRYLIGHDLQPHAIMRAVGQGLVEANHVITSAALCCECGVCEYYACPLHLSPLEVNREIKRVLAEQGWRNTEHRRQDLVTRDMWAYRHVPFDRLLARVDLWDYEHVPVPLEDGDRFPPRVIMALKQHTGAPARPVVAVGDTVRAGQLVGEIPADKLGARVHTSIDGVVTDVVTDRQIVIEAR